MLLVISQASIESAWVSLEVKNALRLERERGKTVLFPISIDDAVFSASDVNGIGLLKEKHIADFRDWQASDRYKRAFSRLVRDLAINASVESSRRS
jgi:hypothetical protein